MGLVEELDARTEAARPPASAQRAFCWPMSIYQESSLLRLASVSFANICTNNA
jgi:hypothetical protein